MKERVTKTLVPGGHSFVVDQKNHHPLGVIDIFRLDENYHNGPECAKCGGFFCQHCNRDIYTEQCPEQDETLPGLEYQ